MNRIEYFKNVRDQCKVAVEEDPGLFPLHGAIYQLEYLISLEEGLPVDISYLKDIEIGWIAARELDGYENKSLIKDLFIISWEVEKIKMRVWVMRIIKKILKKTLRF